MAGRSGVAPERTQIFCATNSGRRVCRRGCFRARHDFAQRSAERMWSRFAMEVCGISSGSCAQLWLAAYCRQLQRLDQRLREGRSMVAGSGYIRERRDRLGCGRRWLCGKQQRQLRGGHLCLRWELVVASRFGLAWERQALGLEAQCHHPQRRPPRVRRCAALGGGIVDVRDWRRRCHDERCFMSGPPRRWTTARLRHSRPCRRGLRGIGGLIL
mmetsp:Transcript_37611/g.103295  ORF Transcript_37611/g.103295 Transcript_37611/m.103295 type:complete len:214 (-) Transcript_37611:157-798(-)